MLSPALRKRKGRKREGKKERKTEKRPPDLYVQNGLRGRLITDATKATEKTFWLRYAVR